MKAHTIYFLVLSSLILASCSVNEDLVKLDEPDDVYFGGQPFTGSASTSNTPSDFVYLEGASEAEQNYYGSGSTSATVEPESSAENDEEYVDYFDADYGRRIENFHTGNNADYIYGNSAMNTNPRFNWNIGLGYSSFGPGMNWGMGMNYGTGGFYPGSSMMMGYSPWYNPWYMDPFYSSFYTPFYRPYSYWASPYWIYGSWGPCIPAYNPWAWYGYPGYPYYGYPYSPWGTPGYVDGGYGSNGWSNEPRSSSTGSTRPSRGGLITPGSSGGGSGIAEQPQTERSEREYTRKSNTDNDTRREVYTRNAETRSTEGYTRRPVDRSSASSAQSSRVRISPYTRQTNTRSDRSYSTYGRSRSASGSSYSRTRSSSPIFDYSPSRSSSPSYSPGGSRSGGSSPSRSGGGSSPSRRR